MYILALKSNDPKPHWTVVGVYDTEEEAHEAANDAEFPFMSETIVIFKEHMRYS